MVLSKSNTKRWQTGQGQLFSKKIAPKFMKLIIDKFIHAIVSYFKVLIKTKLYMCLICTQI